MPVTEVSTPIDLTMIDTGGGQLSLQLARDGAQPQHNAATVNDCLRLDDGVVAIANGQPVTQFGLGSFDDGGFTTETNCIAPFFVIAAATTDFSLTDTSGTRGLHLDVDGGLMTLTRCDFVSCKLQ